MNIYIDTNILFSDPFFKSAFSELLLKTKMEKAVNIYIPVICIKELLVKLSNKTTALEKEMNNKISELNRSTFSDCVISNFKIEDYIHRLNSFYKKNTSDGTFIQLECNNEYFHENLDKAIVGWAPFFSDKKEEYRDSLIWTMVRQHSNENNERSYLITGNYADFWNHDKTALHENLKAEAKNLMIVESIKKLFEIEPSLVDYKKKMEFQKWLTEQNVTTSMISLAIDKYLWNHISSIIDEEIKRFPIKDLDPKFDIGFILPNFDKKDLQVNAIKSITYFENFALFEITTTLDFPGIIHYPNYDKGNFSSTEKNILSASLTLLLTYDADLIFKPSNLKINSVKILI
jgi:predicted nucleic acid-binding protein